MGILDKYRAEIAKTRNIEDDEFPENSTLDESQREEYKKKLNELRNGIEEEHQRKMNAMVNLEEKEMSDKGLIKDEDVDKVIVKHAYCKECGEELVSKAPPMFNPFTFERVCKHECEKCGTVYNLEHAYPRVAFLNKEGEEISAFGQ